MKTLRETTWYVRVASLLVAVWAVWVVAFGVWAWTVPELASPNTDMRVGYAASSVIGLAVAAIGLVVAIRSPGRGAIGGGLLVTLYAALFSVVAVNALMHWGEIVDPRPSRTTPWVPLDSLAALPFLALLVAGVLLLVGGIVHVREPAVRGWREKPWHVRIASLLVAVWAVWLFAWIVWASTIPEWSKPAANDEVVFGYTVFMVMASIVVLAGLFAAFQWPDWGAIGGGLLVTLVAQWASRMAVDGLLHWGELHTDIVQRGSPWVPFDDLAGLPFFVLLPAGVLLVVGGIVHVLHPTHGTTPHAGTAT